MVDIMRKKRDYLFVYMMILALILFVSGFYLGGVIVKGKYDDQIRKLTSEDQAEKSEIKIKYLQTDYVSFYYGVLEPFNNVKNEHFAYIDRINNKDQQYDYKAKSKELLELSKSVQSKMEETNISSSAPLLIKSKESFIESLQYYQKGIRALLNKESMPLEIMKFNNNWLLAQKQFYQSVNDWEKINGKNNHKPVSFEEQNLYEYSLTNWKSLTLHQKNYAISILMEQKTYLLPYHPEDISIHIDALANDDGVISLGINQIGKAIDLFVASNTLNIGDFHKEKAKYYSNTATPLIPLYLTR